MYNKILVPLDGSELAECVLPHVESISRGCGVKNVVFLRIVEPFYLTGADETAGFNVDITERINAERRAEVKKYLEELTSRTNYNGVHIDWAFAEGRPADEIADYAKNNGVDLIAIATHGRSGVSRWVWGSVADRVLRSACVPVLMVRPHGCMPGF
jgi:nucleotide-binding universal stress UspA family protein